MTNSPNQRSGGFPGRFVAWIAGRGRRDAADATTSRAFGDLNDHYLRDIGLWRERSAGPRRYDPWM